MSEDDDVRSSTDLPVESLLKLINSKSKAIATTETYNRLIARYNARRDSKPSSADVSSTSEPNRTPELEASMADRTAYVPEHTGHNVLPNHSLFSRLLRFAHTLPQRPCVRDLTLTYTTGQRYEADHIQLLSDVIHLRAWIWRMLSPQNREDIVAKREVYIAILAPGSYEFTVGILAALALGMAVVPMTVVLPPEEAVYFATKSKSVAVLCSEGAVRLGTQIERLIRNSNPHSTFSCLGIRPWIMSPRLKPGAIIISSDLYLDENAPGVVIFTSGTSGPPKGAVMRRQFTFDTAMAVVDHYQISRDDTLLHILPVHHATGIGIMFFPFLVAGALVEYRSGSFDPEGTWNRWREGGITFFSGVPTLYMRMKNHFEQSIAPLPAQQRDAYVEGARSLRCCLCGTSALPKTISDFWHGILGRKIMLRYGATEIGAVFKVRINDKNVPDGSVGTLFSGCDVKLRPMREDSAGAGVPEQQDEEDAEEGEVCVKSPEMFSKYLFDKEATAAAHTPDGYYRSGDIARKELVNGEWYYWILGRASIDIIKSGGYKISALDIEREILALPYVAEVMVVGVPDEEFGQRVAGAVVLKSSSKLTIQDLRQDLRARLAGYKLPTLLRIIEGELPKSGTGKVVKKILGPQFFPAEFRSVADIQVWTPGKETKIKSKL